MAYEYLDKTTDAMFDSHQMIITSIDIALAFYENVLMRPKFKSQKWYFQKRLIKWNSSFAYGYLNSNRKHLNSENLNLLKEYEQNHSL